MPETPETPETPGTKPKKRKGYPAGKPKAHVCHATCAHTCGELGGRSRTGKPCGRPGGWGIAGVRRGSLRLCRQHDPAIAPPLGPQERELNVRQRRFVMEYCGRCNGNATRAAMAAGYSSNYGVAAATGCALLKHPKIRAAIDDVFANLTMTSKEVIKRISDDARIDVSEVLVLDAEGKPGMKLTPELLEKYGPLIKEIDTDPETGRIAKIRFNDSQSARRDLARIFQLYEEGPPSVNVYLGAMSDEELLQKLNRLSETVAGGKKKRVG